MTETSFITANQAFEVWLHTQCPVVKSDLALKHKHMASNAFTFLRATFFRWAQIIETLCPVARTAPAPLSVGDSHVENFGTWRDVEGRLIWGANDFDEAAVMPYPYDLIRLATSAQLCAPALDPKVIAAAVLTGYRRGLEDPQPFVLSDGTTRDRAALAGKPESARKFWAEIMKALKDAPPTDTPPPEIAAALCALLPEPVANIGFARRTAGTGSLGRPRFIAVAPWRGGHAVREAKALVPSAWVWAHGDSRPDLHFLQLAQASWRAPDPYLSQTGTFILRRLAPDAIKANFTDRQPAKFGRRLLQAMGRELGGLHGASAGMALAIIRHLDRSADDWLADAVGKATAATKDDFRAWKQHFQAQRARKR